ncbi:MAG: AcrB/AcrD/AcrF family protein [Sphingomicrobium sp.]
MQQRKDEEWQDWAFDLIGRYWKRIALIVWLGFCGWFIFSEWNSIRHFALGDTDDNMRIMQVRGLLHGQGWFDLRNYRMNPPFGANIHWSRLVDLPIAGLILLLRPILGGAGAERWAVAIAPLLPYLLLLYALALTARRLIDPRAYPLAFLALFFAGSANGMFMPERIDHHGWQLALLALGMSAIADPKRVRGGLTLGMASALSLAIGLEMLIYIAVMGVATALFWVADAEERERLRAYAVSLGGATALSFLAFASYANRQAVCDALSPVWLSDVLLGGALLYGLSLLPIADWRKRLAVAALAGAVAAAFHALMWPNCLQRLEGVSPEVYRLWLSHVKEARPVYSHGWRIATLIVGLPVTGLVGWGFLVWIRRSEPDRLRRVLGAAAPGIAATVLLLWQTRTGPAAQMLATIGAAALVWYLVPVAWRAKSAVVRVLGAVVIVVAGAGAAVPFVVGFIPEEKPTPAQAAIGKANSLCNSLWGYHPVALQPKGVVFTFVDLGPRLITVTHHDALAGPYHRNGEQIADIMNAFRGSADQAHRLIAKYHSTYLLTCPKSSTTTIFMSEARTGFYAQLEAGQVPKWLTPVALPKDSPFKMWRVTG